MTVTPSPPGPLSRSQERGKANHPNALDAAVFWSFSEEKDALSNSGRASFYRVYGSGWESNPPGPPLRHPPTVLKTAEPTGTQPPPQSITAPNDNRFCSLVKLADVPIQHPLQELANTIDRSSPSLSQPALYSISHNRARREYHDQSTCTKATADNAALYPSRNALETLLVVYCSLD